MPRLKTREVYNFDELSDSAKETARNWWRSCEDMDFETEFMFDDFESVADILGIEFDQETVRLMGGGSRQKPKIYYSGFCSQGDGACFEGHYSYAKGAPKRIREYAPKDETLHAIADSLQALQRKAFYGISAGVQHTGRYCHEHSTTISVDHTAWFPVETVEEDVADLLRDFMRWMYRQLEAEYEYRMSDETVDESILANEYTFTEDGGIDY